MIQFAFLITNNEVEYEALVQGLEFAQSLSTSKIKVCCDSQLVVKQVLSLYEPKEERMAQYLCLVKGLSSQFKLFEITQVLSDENRLADALTGFASCAPAHTCHLDLGYVGYIKVQHLYRVLTPLAHVLLSFCVEYVPLTVSSVFMRVQVF